MLNWGTLDPRRFERGVQQLLQTQHTGLVCLDGAGGDDGRDAQLQTPDGLTIFEVKSFSSRLTGGQKRQIQRSLQTAQSKLDSMTRWVLILPLNPSPAELRWFESKVSELAGDIEIEWRGLSWLDEQAANNEAFRRYVEGPNYQLARAAAELAIESAVLTDGASDLFVRNASLRERVDNVSMHWTVDWSIQGRTQSFALRAKHPDASRADPIRLTPRFTFPRDDSEAIAVKAKLDRVMAFGGSIDLSPEYFQGFEVEASDETKLLLGVLHRPGHLAIQGTTTSLPRPMRATIELRPPGEASDPVAVDVWLRTRTGGHTGVLLSGEDAPGALSVELGVPYRDADNGDGLPRVGATFNISFANPWNYEIADILPVLRLHTGMQRGGTMTIRLGAGLLCVSEVPASENVTVDYSMLLRIAAVLQRLEIHLGTRLRLPDGATEHELKLAEAAIAALDAREEIEAPFDQLTASVMPGQVRDFVNSIPGEHFALHSSHPDFTLTLGNLEIPYGPLAIWMPQVTLANREELLASADSEEPIAKFKADGRPLYIRNREIAEELAGFDHNSK